jgi:dsRNA-specific ribonuclease
VYLIFTVHVKITYHCRIVNSEEVGRGTSGQKSGAAEEAARQALLNLRDY